MFSDNKDIFKSNQFMSNYKKNIPISISILHDLEYNNNISLYSSYNPSVINKALNNKRRSNSEKNTSKHY